MFPYSSGSPFFQPVIEVCRSILMIHFFEWALTEKHQKHAGQWPSRTWIRACLDNLGTKVEGSHCEFIQLKPFFPLKKVPSIIYTCLFMCRVRVDMCTSVVQGRFNYLSVTWGTSEVQKMFIVMKSQSFCHIWPENSRPLQAISSIPQI